MKVLVVYGGKGLSKEADISLMSGAAVLAAAKEAGFEAEGFELTADNIDDLKNKLGDRDVVFPALHGAFGEDGQIQQIFEQANIKYVGCGVEASRICFDKNIYKQKLVTAGILTPKWQIIKTPDEIEALKAPIVIKPVSGGASIDMIVASAPEPPDLVMVNELLDAYNELMAEEYIEGQELAVGILGEVTLPIVEIIPPAGRWFDLASKYDSSTQENIPPQHISEELQERAQALALQIHQLMGCRHLSRTDMIIKGDDIYVLETNTLPGMTPMSLYPKEAKAAGYDMPALVKKLLELAS